MAMELERPPRTGGAAGDVTVVHFTGFRVSLDEDMLRHIHDPLLALADELSESDLVLDFHNVEYLSSLALGILIGLNRKLLTRGRHMTVVNLSPRVHEVFAVTMLGKLLDLRPACQGVEVIDALNQPADQPTRRRRDCWIETPWKGA
jgi:anti-anti-sigma factor